MLKTFLNAVFTTNDKTPGSITRLCELLLPFLSDILIVHKAPIYEQIKSYTNPPEIIPQLS